MSRSVRPIALAWLEQAGERRYVESETRIGRGEQNDIRLADQSVSRDHALIRRVDGVYVISDLDSANGTFVNDKRVNAPRPLSTGDRIRLAESTFTFNLDVAEAAANAGAPPTVSTSISQFLTISGQIDIQNYLRGELRVVSVLFLDLCGFTALSETMSAEQVTLVVNQCFQHLTVTAIRFGGFVDKYIGDAMMVLFGAPNAHEDDAERAVRAAIAMQDELAKYSERLRQRSGITLQMRVGINTGEVLAGDIGSAQFSAFTVMGDTVNLASRLEARARIGHILVNETTYELTKHRIQYSALPPTQIRGKNEPVAAYEVLGLMPEALVAQATAPPPPFAGRQVELEALETVFAEAGRSRTIILCGPAGIGKSRVVDEFCRRHTHDTRAVVLDCGQVVERGGMDPDVYASELRHLAKQARAILVLDHLELADGPTLIILERVTRLLSDSDVLVVVLTRTVPRENWLDRLRLLELPQLSPDDIRAQLRLRSMVQAQVDELDPDERNVLRVASLIGRPWNKQLIEFALDAPSGLNEALRHLVEVGLLTLTSDTADTHYVISGEATRAVIDASLPQVERRRLHEGIALALQREYDPTRPDPIGLERIAWHFARAGKHWQGVEYLLRSADLAVAAVSPEIAVERYRRVLDEADHVTDKKERTRLTVELQERIGDALISDGSLAEAQIAYETAASAASPEREAELHLKLALTGVRRGNPRRVLEITRIVLEQAAMTDSIRSVAEGLAALSLASQGMIPEALERAERCLRFASDSADAGALGLAHFAAGRAHFVAGELTLARSELELSIAARNQAPDPAAAMEARLQLGLILCELGELQEAEACVRQALAAGRAADRWNRASAGLVLGRLFGIRGESSRARRHLHEALGSAEASGARELALELSLELANTNETVGDDLRSLIDTALARQLEPVACRARIRLAHEWCARGDAGDSGSVNAREALKVAHEAALRSRARGLALQEALARRALGQVLAQTGHWPHGAREFEAAAVIQERQAALVELVRTLVAACQAEYVYAASPRRDHIRAQLVRAHQVALRVGMKREGDQAKRLLAELDD